MGVSPDTMDPLASPPPMTYCLIGRNPGYMDPEKGYVRLDNLLPSPFYIFFSIFD